MGQQSAPRASFFRRLATDATANTIAIAAASLVPLMAMVGGGVDASRYYMAQTRLQAACDAGALAARRAMDDDDFAKEHEDIGDDFFVQNYPDGIFGTEDLVHDYSGTEDGEVLGTATGKIPTTVMGAFGFDEFNLSVTCQADINISNTDVVFVLDVTHSMNCPASNPGCSNGSEWTDSKLSNLRDAVVTFYDTVEAATSNAAQVRYGIVPYSQQVNVGDSLKAEWMASSHTYQSREPVFETGSTGGSSSTTYSRTGGAYNWQYQGVETRTWYGLTYSQCNSRASNAEYDIFDSSNQSNWTQVSQTGTNPVVTTFNGTVTYQYYSTNWNYSQSYRSSDGRCRLNQNFWLYDASSTITQTVDAGEPTENFTGWVYKPVTYDISSVKSDGYLIAPTGWDGANVTHNWNGCIEEAATVNTDDFDPVPITAFDLNIDMVPTTDAQKWKPMLPTLTWPRYTDSTTQYWNSTYWTQSEYESTTNKGQPTAWCPKAARKLAEFDDRQDVIDWLKASNGFVAAGNTYHDYGMIWGARFISPDGIFADENSEAPNGDAISRHIIFMTDGEQATVNYVYGLYGMEWWDRRVTGDGSQSQLADRHASRFQAACKAARNKNISVWVVAFGTTLTQNLIDCATPGRAYHADDADELDDAFREIAEKIAALRLTE